MLSLALTLALGSAPTLAISYFDDPTRSAELEPIRRGFAQMLITDFAQLPEAQVLERGKLDLVLGELKLWQTPLVDPATTQKLGKRLAVQYLLLGSVALAGDQLRVEARLVEVKTGKILAAKNGEGTRAQGFALEKDLAEFLVEALALKLSVAERSRLRKAHGKSYDEFVEYSKGLAAFDRGDKAEATKHFENAKGDPALRAIAYDLALFVHYTAPLTDAEDADFDEQFRALDAKSKSLGDTIMYLGHSQYGGAFDSRKVENLIGLAEWVVDRKLSPMGGAGNTTPAESTLLTTLEAFFAADATLAPQMPALYEYLLRKYPNDAGVASNAQRALEHRWPVGREYPGATPNRDAMRRLLTKISAQVKK